MHGTINIWELLSGVAIFLLGMKFLEESLQRLTGRGFKIFLKKQAASKPRAILSGVVVTGVLQSSSVVNFMLLAFVGANIIPMQHALAVLLGSNLGSTVTSWIILAIGFNASIENITFPMIGLGGIIMSVTHKGTKWFQWSKFCLGLGFLLLGLSYIKSGMEGVVALIDFKSFSQYPAIIFLFVGFIITTLLQSSSATMVIVLSALNVHALGLYEACAIVLGSEIGTAVKFLLASIKGPPAKKRVAAGNFMYNVINALVILAFLHAINNFITQTVGIKNNLLALVFFQTLVNVIGIILFYPILNIYGRFLEKLFKTEENETVFIDKANLVDLEASILALENELKHFILHTIAFAREVFDIPDKQFIAQHFKKNYHHSNPAQYYEFLKHLHGEIYGFENRLQDLVGGDEEMSQRLNQLVATNRNSMYTAKTLHDAVPDIDHLRNSSNDVKFKFYLNAAAKTDEYCKIITAIVVGGTVKPVFVTLNELFQFVSGGYTHDLKSLYNDPTHAQLTDVEISTLINFNRQVYTAFKSGLFAVKDLFLATKEAAYFDDLPGFLR